MARRIPAFVLSLSFQKVATTSGFPSVIVPVLSSTMAFTFFAISRLSASFIKIPFSAPFPIPTMIAVGVASPRAHGHAITRTVTIANSPCVKLFSPPKIIHIARVRSEIRMTAGTKIDAILSTSCCTGALLP